MCCSPVRQEQWWTFIRNNIKILKKFEKRKAYVVNLCQFFWLWSIHSFLPKYSDFLGNYDFSTVFRLWKKVIQKAMRLTICDSSATGSNSWGFSWETESWTRTGGKSKNQLQFISQVEIIPFESLSYHSWLLQQPASLAFGTISCS